MKIAYITHTRFPVPKAHGRQIAEVCSALSAIGHDVTLVRPTMNLSVHGDPYEYYGVEKNFTIKTICHFNAAGSPLVPGSLNFAATMLLFRHGLKKYLKCSDAELLYCRSAAVLSVLLGSGKKVILELHTIPRTRVARFVKLANRCARIVALTSPMRDALVDLGVDPGKIIVEGDAVNLDDFASLPSKDDAQTQYSILTDRLVIGYCGSFVTQNTIEKGVVVLIDSLAQLKKAGHRVFGFIVGGPAEYRMRYTEHAERLGLGNGDIRFEDTVASTEVPAVLSACDVLVYPAPRTAHPYFLRDTSPLKLFEYLASGRPTVCANLPPVHDIVSAESVTFFHPGDPVSLSEGITYVLDHHSAAQNRAERGRKIVQEHSWEKRMERILRI